MRQMNEAGLAILKEFEAGPQGNREPALTAYLCPAGILTIGWGHTKTVTAGMMIDRAKAQALLDQDLEYYCDLVDRETFTAPTTDNEFAALVLLAYNIPQDGFIKSSPLRLHMAGKKTEAAASFSLWRKFTNPHTGKLEDSPGLIRRRAMEATLYLERDFHQPATPQEVAPEKSIMTSKTVLTGVTGIVASASALVDNAGGIKDVVDNVTTATASMAGLKAAMGALASGKGLSVVFGVVALVCVVAVVGRYILKSRKGDVTVR